MALTLILYNYEFIDTHCELKLIYQHKTMKQSLIINLSLRNEYLAISRIKSNGLETGGEAFRNPECRSYSVIQLWQYFSISSTKFRESGVVLWQPTTDFVVIL